MNIIVKPVKCGDCSILCGKNEQLLIDCGSDNSSNGLSSAEFAYSAIQDEIRNRELTNIMISHFHKDHFCGVLEIDDSYRFNTAYLPYSIIDGKVIYSEGIARLLSVAPQRSWGFRLSDRILDLFKKLHSVSVSLRFIKKGDRIPFDGNQMRVLWPDVIATGFNYNDLPVKQTLERQLDGINIYEQGDVTDSLENTENKLAELFTKIVGTDNPDLLKAMKDFSERFESYIRYHHESNNENRSESFNVVNEARLLLDDQRRIFISKLDEGKLSIIKDFSRQQYHSLVTSMNAISIVFDCENRFIFLGDVPVNIIDYIRTSFEPQYGYVKLQHHGTSRYFTRNTPKGDYNTISNGGYERRKVCDEYIGDSRVICTNAHNDPQKYCLYYANNGFCSSDCIQVNLSCKINV